MVEIPDPLVFARIGAKDTVDLVIRRAGEDSTLTNLTGHQASIMGKTTMCAGEAVAAGRPRPEVGKIVGDAHLPVMKWFVGISEANAEPTLSIEMPTGVILTFQMPVLGALEMGRALISQGEASSPPVGHRPN